MRRLAASTPGVDLLLGHTVVELRQDAAGTTTGVRVSTPEGERDLHARLVVGADGRESTVARLAQLPTRVVENNRFSYFAHFRDLPLEHGSTSLGWFLEPDVAYAMPNDDGVTVIACIPSKQRLPEFKADVEGSYRRFVRALPGAPPIDDATPVSKIIGVVNHPNVLRRPVGRGTALVGDAALTTDPMWGTGCAWALQSAAWLTEAVAGPLQGHGDLPSGLASYRRRHRRQLRGHQHLISDFSSGRPFNAVERLMFSAAARDAATARAMHAFSARVIPVREFLSPRALARAALVNARHRQSESRAGLPGAA
jgi:2-polyprenyl-6-methoxyphenol hydroxylase-like FAD-dependent oxidoreductase